MNDTLDDLIEYHKDFDLDKWLSQAGIQEDGHRRQMGRWEVNDPERLYLVSPNIKQAMPIVKSWMEEVLYDWVLIGESVREVEERWVDELTNVIVFAAYKLTKIPTGRRLNIKYFGVVVDSAAFYMDGFSRDIDGLNVLGLDKAVPLQLLSVTIAEGVSENEIEAHIENAVKALEYKNLCAMLIDSQKKALDESVAAWTGFKDDNHKAMMTYAVSLQHHLVKTCFDDKRVLHDFAYDIGPTLFAISVCPELYFYQANVDWWIQSTAHSPWEIEDLKDGQMIDLNDIEGLYLIGKPSKKAKNAIVKRLSKNCLPPPYSYEAARCEPSEANHYTYDVLDMIVVQPKTGADGMAGLPVYLYTVEECNNRYRGDNKEDAIALNWRAVWIYAEQIDTDGNVLLSGDEAFASVDINSDHLKFGYCSEGQDYELAKEAVRGQLEPYCIRSVVSRTQAMRVRLAAADSVYGDKPILETPKVCTDMGEAFAEQRFDVIEMSAKQIEEYRHYSAALKERTDTNTKKYEICSGFIVIDYAPWDFNNLVEYSVITQVFMPIVDEYGDEVMEWCLLMERYDCSVNESAPQLLSAGLAGDEPELQINLSFWLESDPDRYCPYEISLTDDAPMLTLGIVRWALEEFEKLHGNKSHESTRLERKLKTWDLERHFLEIEDKLRVLRRR